MIQKPSSHRQRSRSGTGRRRGRPPGSTNAARAARLAAAATTAVSEPPPKRRRYIPGGAGGGGRFVEIDSVEGASAPEPAASRPKPARRSASVSVAVAASTSVARRVARNPRRRRENIEDSEEFGSAAAVAAAVAQSEGYKPREERGWEEFHPNLDIEATFKVFSAAEVDGTLPSPAATSVSASQETGQLPSIPIKRRVGRPPRDLASTLVGGLISRTPVVLPINNQTPKERLDLKRPSYRRTDRVSLFESKSLGTARYVDNAMANVGFQETDRFERREKTLIKASDSGWDDDHHDHLLPVGANDSSDGSSGGNSISTSEKSLGRVEYDMDEQDDMWLEAVNRERKEHGLGAVTRELFEITITKIEKEWHALEKRIPKPNPKPPQTQRPRSSSAAAVNGELQVATAAGPGEEQDSKCAICDDGDCENTNAIVFCDGCDLAVHQECYGVPFIPEGQWLCRKCQLIGRGIPTCIFCPNTDGAFKQTNASKWAHLLCAMWIPEVSLGNATFMEPVMEVEKVPKTRWKLSCYICKQRMGACIQCSNKNCYQAFHVTCARRARLFLKMKTSQGVLAVLDGGMVLKAFCDRHCPLDYTEDNKVAEATRAAKRFYRKKMKGRMWADNQATAALLAAQHTVSADKDAEASGSPGPTSASDAAPAGSGAAPGPGESNKGIVWKLPSGAPVIPAAVFELVDTALARFAIRKRRDFVAQVCRYWTLKREARRGAALLKRLQLQMETFSSMELTRRNFAAMGPSGRARLQRRIEFAEALVRDLEGLQGLMNDVVQREAIKLEAVAVEEDFVNTCYFPVARELKPVICKAQSLDENVFATGLLRLQERLDSRFYTTTLTFASDFAATIHKGIVSDENSMARPRAEGLELSPTKQNFGDMRARKTLGKCIVKAVQPFLDSALAAEAAVIKKPVAEMQVELEKVLEMAWEEAPVDRVDGKTGQVHNNKTDKEGEDLDMQDAPPVVQTETPDADMEDSAPVAEKPAAQTTPPEAADYVPEAPDAEAASVSDATPTAAPDAEPAANDSSNGPAPASSSASASASASVSAPPQTTTQTPPTPPQSNVNMSFVKQAPSPNVLRDGGSLWYLAGFNVRGLSAMEHQAESVVVEAVQERGVSEELTDIDDDELKGLGRDVEAALSVSTTVMAASTSAPTAFTSAPTASASAPPAGPTLQVPGRQPSRRLAVQKQSSEQTQDIDMPDAPPTTLPTDSTFTSTPSTSTSTPSPSAESPLADATPAAAATLDEDEKRPVIVSQTATPAPEGSSSPNVGDVEDNDATPTAAAAAAAPSPRGLTSPKSPSAGLAAPQITVTKASPSRKSGGLARLSPSPRRASPRNAPAAAAAAAVMHPVGGSLPHHPAPTSGPSTAVSSVPPDSDMDAGSATATGQVQKPAEQVKTRGAVPVKAVPMATRSTRAAAAAALAQAQAQTEAQVQPAAAAAAAAAAAGEPDTGVGTRLSKGGKATAVVKTDKPAEVKKRTRSSTRSRR
ncbi:hypothetical protein TD95_000970 [Thielaviopsis punctulata]|uniref:PHD-type domain-containing protein n=1 Tax=Thielaviopsis punctulata TaxID=72032 RepID=A0A0F4ZE12_9PEZI|nr:hypothetical protein TD95_000970 [Thielaviopsis punctulata]